MNVEDRFVSNDPTTRLSLQGINALDTMGKTSAFENLSGAQIDAIPCLDLEWAFASEANKIRAAQELHMVMRDIGFMCLKNHGIDLVLKEQVETIARKFFHLPTDVKEQYADKQWPRGWGRLFYEAVGEGQYKDVREGFVPPLWADDLQELWVKEVPAFKPTLLNYMDSVRGAGLKVNRLMALSLGLDEEYFNRELFWNGIGFGNELVRLNFYPENLHSNSERGTFGLGQHTDAGWLTFLAFDGKPGLEIRRADGTWFMPKNVTKDMIVINQGDFVERITNGRYRSTVHRVQNPDGKERVSFPMFFNPNFNVIGKPIEKLLNPGEELKYEPMTFRQHIFRAMRAMVRNTDDGKVPDLEQLSPSGL
eukprot:Clim_evm13s100 gene=Clim_evmTU13s100